MLFAFFDDATSATYGATGDRPLKRIMSAPDTATADLNVATGETYITITDFVTTTNYKVSWVSAAWALTARSSVSATWSKTSILANGVDSATLSTLPSPTPLYVLVAPGSALTAGASTNISVTDGSFTFATDTAGTYTVGSYDPFPYAPFSQAIVAA